MDHRVYLKVKIKSLAAEAKIIRQEEKKNKDMRLGLAHHRKTVVRDEARHTLLAYAFIRGRAYTTVEHQDSKTPNWESVEKMIKKYGIVRDWENENSAQFTLREKATLELFKEWKPKKK